jgi:hypothetical protein
LLMYAESTQHTRLEGETRLAMFYCWDTRQGTEDGKLSCFVRVDRSNYN